MSKQTALYSNNARTTLAADATSVTNVLQVSSAAGFPVPTATGDFFYVTLDDGVNLEIVKVTGISGNSFTGCVRGQEGTTPRLFSATTRVENRLTAGNITSFARKQDRLAPVNSVEDLISPTATDGNSALCATVDAWNVPIVAVAHGTKWRLLNYPDLIMTGAVSGSATTTQINISGIGNNLKFISNRDYIIQFTSGANNGLCRFITSIPTNTLNWTTALPVAPSSGDSFEILRCSQLLKAPTGGQADRVFFENDAQIWANYNIPSGKNASSTGPVTVNVGATITVPVGSSWSII